MPKLKTIEANPEEMMKELALLYARKTTMAAEADEAVVLAKQTIAAEFKGKSEPLNAEIKAVENKFANWLKQNRQKFDEERTVTCEFGSYGFRLSHKVTIEDQPELMRFCLMSGDAAKDIGRFDFKADKEGIRARFVAGEKVPGCTCEAKDTGWFDVDQKAIDRLMKDAGKVG